MAVENTGVLAWCDSIRFTMAKDPGRELFATQIQQHGFDFLDNYIEDVLARQPTDSLYDLMKTPGKKKDSSKRARTVTTTAMKLKGLNSTIFEEKEEDKENPAPVNDFHKALMDARDEKEPKKPSDITDTHPAMKKTIPHTVTIMDSPSPPAVTVDEDHPMDTEVSAIPEDVAAEELGSSSANVQTAEIDVEIAEPLPSRTTSPLKDSSSYATEPLPSPPVSESSVPPIVTDETAAEEPPKELSMIAEDDEPTEQSDVRPSSSEPAAPEPAPAATTVYDMDQDITVPLRDSSSSGSLKRKQSVTQFSGLPAPSPLRKSMRMSREPSVGAGLLAPSLAQTPGAGLGGKRTSWLTKAKEAKALELTGTAKRHALFSEGSASNAVGLGLGLPSGFRKADSRPSSRDIFDAAPPASSNAQTTVQDDDDTNMKIDQPTEIPATKKKPSPPLDDDFTGRVDSTHAQPQHGTWPSRRAPSEVPPARQDVVEDLTVPISEEDAEAGALDRLKRALEGAGARSYRSLGKSLGGNAAAALAEARAAAEKRVAQRNVVTGEDVSVVEIEQTTVTTSKESQPKEAGQTADQRDTRTHVSPEADKRLSLSDLVSTSSAQKVKQTAPVSTTQVSPRNQEADTSTSTTPPNSPPVVMQKPSVPIFKPVLQPSKDLAATKAPTEMKTVPSTDSIPPFVFKLASTDLPAPNPFNVKTAAPIPSGSKPLTAESSKASLFSDNIFDKPGSSKGWLPTQETQDTEYSTAPMQPQEDELDDDDSWHMDEKFRANETWTPYGFVNTDKTDNTWSTLPSRSTSQHGDTELLPPPTHGFAQAIQKAAQESNENYVVHTDDDDGLDGAFDFDTGIDHAQIGITDEDLRDLEDVDMDLDDGTDEVDLDDIVAAGKATISLVQKPVEPTRPQSQMSLNSVSSSSSQQSNVGFLGQASRFMSNVLGTSKPKGKNEPVKSIIRAAAIAKKQQEEADKKASRLREMENRRQQAMQRKAEEEKARVEEEQKRIREENEKRKREREEHTGKLPVLKAVKKTEDDTMSKRKLAESQKKPESKKPPSKDTQPSRTMKPPMSTNLGASTKLAGPSKSALSKQASSSSLAASSSMKDTTALKSTAPSSAMKASAAKGKTKVVHKEDAQPSDILQSQMADRAKAQVQAAQTPRQPPPVASESIELPDINSEYSDSDDEDRPKSFNPPEWAQSPELRQQLEDQSRYNPDDIFGRIGPLRMEEIFRTRQSRFRARTSSANWAGPDELTEYEEREYARRMGYTSKP
ncbi:hypothetical protein BC629DRAFT_1720065 [Irpex lacteus]|nr:hypothetical protein BC629DRAFT_1720065 [Irpex lacteus]